MSSLRWRPALKYHLYNGIKALGIFFAIMILITIVIPSLISLVIEGHSPIDFNFTGFGFGSIIMFFVLGIIVVRENIKLLLQNGCGRRTVFATDVLGSLVLALLMAVGSELLSQLLGTTRMGIEIGLGELSVFRDESTALPALQSTLLRFCGLVLAWRVGMFISMVYYRLNRWGQVIVSIIVPALLFVGLPLATDRGLLGPALFSNAFRWLIGNPPYNAVLAALVAALLCGLCSWLLLRKAQVKE